MEYTRESNRIYAINEDGKLLAEVTFPKVTDDVVDINHTFVDDSLRGQGIAGKLMEEVVAFLRENHKKAVLTCSYAILWFGKNDQYKGLIWEGNK
jgi:predicted GNAT family acetyltransferase